MTPPRGPREQAQVPITILVRSPSDFARLSQELRALDSELQRMHPGSRTEPLSRYGLVLAPEAQLTKVLDWLRAHPRIEAAFTKPADFPP